MAKKDSAQESALNVSHGSEDEATLANTTHREVLQEDEIGLLKVQLMEANKAINQLRMAADPRRMADVQRSEKEKDGHLLTSVPSLDGRDPIVVWRGEGFVAQDSNKNEVDTQMVNYETLGGQKGKLPYAVFMSQVQRYAIKVQTNNLPIRKNRDQQRVHDPREPHELINVTASDDNGKSYAADTFDIQYCLLNIGPRSDQE